MSAWISILSTILKLAVAVVGWLERERLKAEGRQEAKAEAKAHNDALQEHFDEIDARPTDLDSALSRLRDRANRDGG